MTDHIDHLKTLVGPVWDVPLVPYIEPAERAADEPPLDTLEDEEAAPRRAPPRRARTLLALHITALMGTVAFGCERSPEVSLSEVLMMPFLRTSPDLDPDPPGIRIRPGPQELRQAPAPEPTPAPRAPEPDFSPPALERVLAI